jgi:hypothetical protein
MTNQSWLAQIFHSKCGVLRRVSPMLDAFCKSLNTALTSPEIRR